MNSRLACFRQATAGGGGHGMRLVKHPDEFVKLLHQAKSEVAAAFDNDGIYLEKYIQNPRHIEFQGHATSLGTSSIDGQKHMTIDSLALSVPRKGFLLINNGNVVHFGECDCSIQQLTPSGIPVLGLLRFYFMEMSTRIQEEIVLRGDSIEHHINAEDAFKGFRPGPDYVVPPSYDSLLGKEKAIERMKRALDDTIITELMAVGSVPTTIEYHKLVLDIEDFRNWKVDTTFFFKHDDKLREVI
ncbi:hypothetical protein MLD38_014163 [Melastoma candidum]|uniref:Uncharacterized protein n=1 Tax=Melastoma candidum TaxID=119954 RepID=A0ACB9RBU3_9MYRT|nr:hypothetical protein MLD38_014163 [Melastoma candidum]